MEADRVGSESVYRVVPDGLRSPQAEIDKFWTDELDSLVADALGAEGQTRGRPMTCKTIEALRARGLEGDVAAAPGGEIPASFAASGLSGATR